MITSDRRFDKLITTARVHLPGAVDAAIKDELWYVLDEFLEETQVWQTRVNVNVPANRTKVTFEPRTEDGEIMALLWLENSDESVIDGSMPNVGELTFDEAETAARTVTAVVSLKPTTQLTNNDFPDVPDWIVNRYGRALLAGLLSRMFMQPAKTYTNVQLAGYHGSIYRRAVTSARAEAIRQHRLGGQRWSFPQSFATSRRQ